jgi:hypothetical protein
LLLAGLALAAGDHLRIEADPKARQPQAAVDEHGVIYVVYGVENEIRLAVSTDGGARFSKPTVVAKIDKLALGMRRGPRIAVTKDAIIVAAVVRDDAQEQAARHADPSLKHYQSATGDLLAWRSADSGKTWSDGVRLNTVPASAREGLHALAARPDGSVWCVWLDLRDGVMSLYGAVSSDHGATWPKDYLFHRSAERAICTCCHPSLAFASVGRPWLMWRDDIKGARDMYLGSWSGHSWQVSDSQKLGAGTWIVDRCPMDGGAIAIDSNDEVTTVWMRAERVYATNTRNIETLLGPGVQPWAAGAEKGAHVVWLSKRPGILMHREPGGRVTELAQAANDPIVASGFQGRGPVVVAWEGADDERGIFVKIVAPSD